MQPLYQIKNEYLQALNELENMEGLTPQMIQDSLASIDVQFEEKALAVAAYIKNLELEFIPLETYYEAVQERMRKIENKVEHLKNYLKQNMTALEKKKIEGVEFDISIRTSNSKVVIDDETRIGQEWYRREIVSKLDKEALRNALQNGTEISGAHLEQGVSLTIK